MGIIITLLILIFLGSMSYFIYSYYKSYKIELRQSSIIFDLDTSGKNIRINSDSKRMSWFPFSNDSDFERFSDWIPIIKLGLIFNDSENIAKKIRTSLYTIETENKDKVVFNHILMIQKKKYELRFKFYKFTQETGILEISWKREYKAEKVIHIYKNADSFINDKDQRKHNSIFGIKFREHLTQEQLQIIAEEVSRHLHFVVYYFWLYQGLLYFIVSGNTKSHLNSSEAKITKFFSNENSEAGSFKYIEGVGYIKDFGFGISRAMLNQLERKISFIVYSIEKSTPSFSKVQIIDFSTLEYDTKQYEKFKDATSIFNAAIRSNNISTVIKKVINTKTEKTSGLYALPTLKDILKKDEEQLVSNTWNHELMINIQIENVLVYKTIKLLPGTIIDINDEWFIRHSEKVTNKTLLYVINLSTSTLTPELINLMNSLSQNGLKFGLRINSQLRVNSSIIEKISLYLLVIDEDISQITNKGAIFSKILFLNKVISESKIKTIFINPTTELDENQRKTLNIQYALFTK